MTHDPFCPTQTMCKCKDQECWDCRDPVWCQCDLIAKVRADQVERDAAIVKDFGWSPETDDADIDQVIADLKEALNR